SRRYFDPAAIALGAESDPRAVGRKRRPALVGRVLGQADWGSAAQLLDPDIEVALPTAVGGVSQQLARGKQDWIGREAGVRSQPGQDEATAGLRRRRTPEPGAHP